ncbi:MAG TPA: DUF3106 domain-containing protein [Burkholderiaceae bacterium]|nr:DUF3106 domain-containing protein [Burkholderiaceae bacterium]HQR72638.1 DUF3106 domain-containing protein [Burkholderiaceae bacterium]
MRSNLTRGALGLLIALTCLVASAQTQSRPAWTELSPAQREALAPLAKDWNAMDSMRKRKWLEVAAKYPNLSPEGKQKLHERMGEFARLTPEQRDTARKNFRRAYEVPADQRQATVQKFQDLPPEKKQALADKAAARPEPQRRPSREVDVKPARPPAKTEPTAQ